MVRLLTRKETAEYLNISESALHSWVKKENYNNLPIIKIGKSVRYKLNDIEEYIEKNRKTSNDRQ